MVSKALTYLQYGNCYCGLEHSTSAGVDVMHISILKKSKKEVILEDYFQVSSIEDISKKLPNNQHVSLIVNNDQVLSKSIDSDQTDAFKLIYKAFPNINLDEFYYEAISEGSRHFISICRKNYIDTLITEYSKLNLHIIDIGLGNNLITDLKPYLDETEIQTSNATITFENGTIKNIEKTTIKHRVYDINGQQVSNQNMLSFAGALSIILNRDTRFSNFDKRNLIDSFKQNRFFTQFLRFAGLFILMILLINFLFFNHYFNQVNELKQVSQINQTTKDQIVKLNASVSKQQKMVDDLLNSSTSKSSYYANEIMQSLSNTIILNEFSFQPLQKRVKADKPIELQSSLIAIAGSTSNSDLFSEWIAQLEKKNWIQAVEIHDYGAEDSHSSNFKIHLQLKDD